MSDIKNVIAREILDGLSRPPRAAHAPDPHDLLQQLFGPASRVPKAPLEAWLDSHLNPADVARLTTPDRESSSPLLRAAADTQ